MITLFKVTHTKVSTCQGLRGDMIEVYKFFNNIYSATTGWLTDRHMQINYDVEFNFTGIVFINLRFDMIHVNSKYSFSNRIIPLWNSLPEKVVPSSTVKSFKMPLDRFQANEEIYYNYKTNIICHAPEVEVIMTLIQNDICY